MIATIAGTAAASFTTIITRVQRNTSSKASTLKANGGAWRLPRFVFFAVSSRKRAESTHVSRTTRTAKAV
jgi:hypothetical protein